WGPGAIGLLGSWWTAPGATYSSRMPRFPLFHASSVMRRAAALFCSVDIGTPLPFGPSARMVGRPAPFSPWLQPVTETWHFADAKTLRPLLDRGTDHAFRSEERRVGKEGRSRGALDR